MRGRHPESFPLAGQAEQRTRPGLCNNCATGLGKTQDESGRVVPKRGPSCSLSLQWGFPSFFLFFKLLQTPPIARHLRKLLSSERVRGDLPRRNRSRISDRPQLDFEVFLEIRESKKPWRKNAAARRIWPITNTEEKFFSLVGMCRWGCVSQIPPRARARSLAWLSCDLSEWRSRWTVCILSHSHAPGGLRSVAAATEQVIDPQTIPGSGGGLARVTECPLCGRRCATVSGRP